MNPARAAIKYSIAIPQILLRRGKFRETLEVLGSMMQLDADNPYLHLHKAQALAGLGAQNQAIRWAQLALTQKPDLAWAHLLKGQMLKHLGRHGEAGESLTLALKNGAPKGLCYAELTELEIGRGDGLRAADMAEATLKCGVQRPDLLQRTIQLLLSQGKQQRARDLHRSSSADFQNAAVE